MTLPIINPSPFLRSPELPNSRSRLRVDCVSVALFHDREGFDTECGTKVFAIMKCPTLAPTRPSHLPPQAHPPLIPGVLMINYVIVDIDASFPAGLDP
jgi:hypothetical protein